MVFMVQKEVAERFSAKPKSREYGSISVFLNYYYNIKNLFIVPKKCFYPVPGVDSAVIALSSKDNLLDVDVDKFNKLVKNSFQFKRKNLRNNLRPYDLEKINSVLEKHGFSLDNRAEDLPYEVFVDIANNL
jgi:16S rRNA (adenine1518-N6/adenine1519-N6)-dimethyltransferase